MLADAHRSATSSGILGRLAVRVFALVLGVVALAALLPSLAIPFTPAGRMGYSVDGTRVTTVAAGSPAARAGLRAGDVVVRRDPDFGGYAPGTAVTLYVTRDRHPLRLDVRTEVLEPWTPVTTFVAIVSVVFSTIAIVGTVVLAVRHPSWATALLCVSSLNLIIEAEVFTIWTRVLKPENAQLMRAIVSDAVTVFPSWTFVLFALAFPRQLWSRWRAIAAVPVVAIIVAVPFANAPLWVNNGVVAIAFPIAFVCFAFSYARAEPRDQRRLTWLMVAVGITLACGLAVTTLAWLGLVGENGVAVLALNAMAAVAWLGVVYVVWRRNVIGVAFALNRSLVVAVITGALLGAVSLARWLGEHLLVRSGIVGFFEVAVTVLFGYGLNTFARRIQAVIERFVFRDRYAAEQRVLRTIAALPFATSRTTISEAVVDEACDELRLTSAALFLRDGDQYVRVRDANWPADAVAVVGGEDRLVRVLHAENATLFLRELQWRRTDLPTGEAQPVVVIPLTWRAQLTGFAVYGRHRDGSELDPQELALLERVVNAATVTYETAELGELRRRIAYLERQLITGLPS